MAETTHDTRKDSPHSAEQNEEVPGEELLSVSKPTAVECKFIRYADPGAVEKADARIARKFFRMFRKLAE